MKKKILAIDDSKAIRFLLQTVFSKNYQIITASDGCSGFMLRSNHILNSITMCRTTTITLPVPGKTGLKRLILGFRRCLHCL